MARPATVLRIATRASPLARWQAEHVGRLLRAASPAIALELVMVETYGDRRPMSPIWELGGKGAFVKEVQEAVLDGRADLAVHSAKDLPSATPEGLVIAAVPERGDPRDALVGAALAELPAGAEVATGSLRRRSQLAALRPDLRFVGLRGNMHTRLAKAGRHGAIVAAAAALDRLGLADRIAERLAVEQVVPQVGQGALAVECQSSEGSARPGVRELLEMLERIQHAPSRCAVDAERAFLAELGGDCSVPAGAHAVALGAGDAGGAGEGLAVEGVIASVDGAVVLRHRVEGASPEALGRALARHLLDYQGGAALVSR